jgi:hypothetical protein
MAGWHEEDGVDREGGVRERERQRERERERERGGAALICRPPSQVTRPCRRTKRRIARRTVIWRATRSSTPAALSRRKRKKAEVRRWKKWIDCAKY